MSRGGGERGRVHGRLQSQMFGSEQSSSRCLETSPFKMLRNVVENSQKAKPRKFQDIEKATLKLNFICNSEVLTMKKFSKMS